MTIAKTDDLHAETEASADALEDHLRHLLNHLPDAPLRVRAVALVELGRMAEKAGKLAAAAEKAAAKTPIGRNGPAGKRA
ncbi:MAG TPA: hypothetical protein VKE74_17525 [Gemmataceae bacterium]|nr:hypothetical protein [Gemmataceae bacterium]